MMMVDVMLEDFCFVYRLQIEDPDEDDDDEDDDEDDTGDETELVFVEVQLAAA